MINGFPGLIHNPIISRHNQDNHVRNLGAARTHLGKGSVAGGIQKNHVSLFGAHVVSADMLGNAAGFA